jgi:myo-inositol 2-dehydrogenase / D-chiro-inositol 1-dehydrogenase
MTGIALFGAGTIGHVHARNIAAHPGCELKYVVDKDIGRAEALCRAHGGQAAADIETALKDKAVDAVVVASSTSAHYAHLSAVIAAGKPVLCEKPIADDLGDAKRCADAAAAAGLVAATAFNRRYDASYLAVHDRIRAGEIGKVEMIHIISRTQAPTPAPESVRLSGGMLREKGSHHYDLAAWLSGAEPVEIFAAGDCLVDPGFAEYGDLDTAALTLRLDSGALVTFSFSRRTAFGYEEMIEVFGSEGMLEAGRQRRLSVALYKQDSVIEAGLHAGWYERFGPTYRAELDAFLAAAQGRGAAYANLADGLRAQAVAEAAIRSVREKRMVPIERIW